MKTIKIIGEFLLAILTISLLAFAFMRYLDLPTAYFNPKTGDCIRVVNYVPTDNWTCDNIKQTRYHHEYDYRPVVRN